MRLVVEIYHYLQGCFYIQLVFSPDFWLPSTVTKTQTVDSTGNGRKKTSRPAWLGNFPIEFNGCLETLIFFSNSGKKHTSSIYQYFQQFKNTFLGRTCILFDTKDMTIRQLYKFYIYNNSLTIPLTPLKRCSKTVISLPTLKLLDYGAVGEASTIHMSHEKKPSYFPLKSWLFDRDPG